MKASELLPYLAADVDVVDGDMVTIVSIGTVQEFQDGNQRLQLNLKVPSGKTKIFTLNTTSLRQLQQGLGDDVDGWTSKKVKVAITQQNVRGAMKKVVYLSAV